MTPMCELCYEEDGLYLLTAYANKYIFTRTHCCKECLIGCNCYCTEHNTAYFIRTNADGAIEAQSCPLCAFDTILRLRPKYVDELINFLQINRIHLDDRILALTLSKRDLSAEEKEHILQRILVQAELDNLTLEQGVVHQLEGREHATLH